MTYHSLTITLKPAIRAVDGLLMFWGHPSYHAVIEFQLIAGGVERIGMYVDLVNISDEGYTFNLKFVTAISRNAMDALQRYLYEDAAKWRTDIVQ